MNWHHVFTFKNLMIVGMVCGALQFVGGVWEALSGKMQGVAKMIASGFLVGILALCYVLVEIAP